MLKSSQKSHQQTNTACTYAYFVSNTPMAVIRKFFVQRNLNPGLMFINRVVPKMVRITMVNL